MQVFSLKGNSVGYTEQRHSSLGKDIECMQILLVAVYRSQAGCRHLLWAHSGQTHAANPQA